MKNMIEITLITICLLTFPLLEEMYKCATVMPMTSETIKYCDQVVYQLNLKEFSNE